MNMSEPEYRAVVFDLLTALLDSWSLWNQVARSATAGFAWRKRYLELTYEAGPYRPCEMIIREAAQGVGVPSGRVDELLLRWGELRPWPEARQVLQTLREKLPLAVVTNSSIALAKVAESILGISIPTVINAEEAGYYKPHPRPYRLALQRLACEAAQALFVAGSPADVLGASAAGMPVYWHNRLRLPSPDFPTPPRYVSDSLRRLLEIV